MDNNRIQIYQDNPYYWQYEGKPALLLGGSTEKQTFEGETR